MLGVCRRRGDELPTQKLEFTWVSSFMNYFFQDNIKVANSTFQYHAASLAQSVWPILLVSVSQNQGHGSSIGTPGPKEAPTWQVGQWGTSAMSHASKTHSHVPGMCGLLVECGCHRRAAYQLLVIWKQRVTARISVTLPDEPPIQALVLHNFRIKDQRVPTGAMRSTDGMGDQTKSCTSSKSLAHCNCGFPSGSRVLCSPKAHAGVHS